MTASPVLPQAINVGLTGWANADTAPTKKTIFTAGSNGSKVTSIIAGSTDTTARVFIIYLNRSSTSYRLTSTTVAITAGTDGLTQSANMLNLIAGLPKDNDGQSYILLKNGDIIQAENQTTVTSAKNIDITVTGADF